MAATNPLRVKDLLHKYGWDFMARLASLGVQYQAEAQILFVDSGATNASDVDDGEHGHSFDVPLATIDYAIGLCTADEGSVILVAPGHNESLAAATIDFDVAGVRVIGLGQGSLTPRIDFDNAASSIDIGANDVSIENIKLLPSTDSVLIGVDVESGITGFRMKDVEFMIGEDGSGDDEFVKAIELKSGNHDCIFENVKILAHASAAEATHGINIAAASDRLTFKNVIIDGPYATGGIVEAAAGVNHIVEDCSIDTSGTNYSFDNSSTFAKYTRNVDAGVDSEDAEALIEVARGTGNYPTGITDNSILAYILGSGGTASASTYNNTTDSLQAIADAISAIDNTTNLNTAVSATPTARSLQDILEKDGTSDFDCSTDSLEAIADALAAGTGCTVAIEADDLDHLLTLDGATQVYPENCATDSIIAKILVKADPAVPSEYDNSTDSLEAISDALAAGTGCTVAIEADDLDHLLKLDGATQVYPENCATDSILAKILVKADPAVPSEFDNSTDSLEAIADAIGVAQADLNILTGASGANLLTATQDSIDAIEADTAVIEPGAKRIAVKATGDMTGMDTGEVLFTVTGAVLARVCGVVGTQIDSTSGTTTLEVGVAGNTALLCVQDAADHTAFDANFCWTKTVAADSVGAELADEWVVIPGGLDIILTISADDLTQGTMDFYCEWIPLSANGNVVATP